MVKTKKLKLNLIYESNSISDLEEKSNYSDWWMLGTAFLIGFWLARSEKEIKE